MATFTLDIPDTEAPFFTKLIESLGFVRRLDAPATKPAPNAEEPDEEYRPKTKEEIKADIREAWDELIEVRAGRKQARPAREVLEELKQELGQ